ncbi:HNH endonuclease [Streptomyces sp. NPDC020983]|uniref:HNH endonuclease n=1 Tax=Streptomyces sp. NPDC020983 TaxID=3365106 RepID=UPI00378E00CA
MAKKPDTPCAGCGKLLWSGGSSLPPGERRCRECRRIAAHCALGHQPCSRCQVVLPISCFSPSAHGVLGSHCRDCQAAYSRDHRQPIEAAPCDDCETPTKRPRTKYGRFCDQCVLARKRSRNLRKNHARRAPQRVSDVTPEYERNLRRDAHRCSLCQVAMTGEAGHPNSKQLDHIVPIGIGGTHTIGNVRIICRTCNLSRPKDGSDLQDHQPTLWAQDPALAMAVAISRHRRQCRDCGDTLRGGRCWTCSPSRARVAISVEVGHEAARMRAGGRKWQDISDDLGLSGAGAAYNIALKHGDSDDVEQWPRPWR